MRKIFLRLFVFALLLSFFVPIFSAAAGERTGKPLTQMTILGVWEQKINNRQIARKEIYLENGVVRIKYLWLAEGYGGGKYGKMTKEADGSYSFTEDYGNFKGMHNIKLINGNSIQGTQKGRTGLVSNYEMTRIQSTPPSGSNEWVFVGGYNNKEEWKKDERQANYLFRRSASSNSATITKIYAASDSKGEQVTATIDWTSPPNIIKPDQKFAMQININIAPKGLVGGGGLAALIERWLDEKGNVIAGGSMSNKDSSTLSGANNIHSATIYGYLGYGKKKGERRIVDLHTSMGGPFVLTTYIYEWR